MKTIYISKYITSKYAISLSEAKKVVENNQLDGANELTIDFEGVELATSPFVRIIFETYQAANPKLANTTEKVAEKWAQIREENASGFDVYKAIEELNI